MIGALIRGGSFGHRQGESYVMMEAQSEVKPRNTEKLRERFETDFPFDHQERINPADTLISDI